jgi:hypothetical protein
MKTFRNCTAAISAVATLTLCVAGIQTSKAQTNTNRFPASVNLICLSTNQSGGIVYQRVRTADFVEECALEMGVTNVTGLSLVFNRSNRSLEVVNGTNQTALCTPLSFEGGVALANSNNTRIVSQSFVFVDPNTTAGGLLSAIETLTWGTSNQLTSFGLRGELSYSFTNGTNSPALCGGVLLVGSAIHQDDDDDDDDDNGRHRGHHIGRGHHKGRGNGHDHHDHEP